MKSLMLFLVAAVFAVAPSFGQEFSGCWPQFGSPLDTDRP